MYVMYDSLHSNGKEKTLEMRVGYYKSGDIKLFIGTSLLPYGKGFRSYLW